MIGDRSNFMELDKREKGFASFGDDTKVDIKGKGTILIQTKDGSNKVLCDLYYIPKLTSNFLSIG